MDIFKAYDIRGLFPKEINPEVVKKTANAISQTIPSRVMVVGEDVRLSSSELRKAAIEGLNDGGSDVIYIGQVTTPLFYFAVNYFKADGGLMVTASHNPAEYNGLKITGAGAIPIGIENGLREIQEKYIADAYSQTSGGKVSEKMEIATQEYAKFLIEKSQLKTGDIKLKVAIDTGNAAGAITMKPLLDGLGINSIPVNLEIIGSFPNRPPDPALPGAIEELKTAILENKADLGFAFDGDADRLMVLDEAGDVIEPQYILAMLWEGLGKPSVVYDLRFSKSVKEFFAGSGIVSRVGHTFISNKMQEADADLAGETSGHFFFKDMNYTESSELAALLVVKILQESGKKLSELVGPFQKYFYSGEINIPSDKGWGGVREKLLQSYPDGRQDELDGVTIEYPDWWFNVRPSNTEPMLRVVVEATTKELLEEKVQELSGALW